MAADVVTKKARLSREAYNLKDEINRRAVAEKRLKTSRTRILYDVYTALKSIQPDLDEQIEAMVLKFMRREFASEYACVARALPDSEFGPLVDIWFPRHLLERLSEKRVPGMLKPKPWLVALCIFEQAKKIGWDATADAVLQKSLPEKKSVLSALP